MKRKTWIDFVKILAIALVVVLHTIKIGVIENRYESGLFIYYIGTFAIPLFFMVNGYLQLSRQKDYKYVLKKVLKILFIIFIWNILYVLVTFLFAHKMENIFEVAFNTLLQKGFFSQFWFLGALIIIYLILPILQKVFRNSNSEKYKIITISFICISIIVDIISVILNNKFNICMKDCTIQTFNIWTWLAYFCLGGYIYNTDLLSSLKKHKHCILTISMFSICLIYESIMAKNLYGNMFAENFYNSPIIIITCILLFTYIKKIEFKSEKIINILGSLTMGVYIIHSVLISFICKIHRFSNNYESIILFLVTIITSIIISWLISKIKKVNEIIKL